LTSLDFPRQVAGSLPLAGLRRANHFLEDLCSESSGNFVVLGIQNYNWHFLKKLIVSTLSEIQVPENRRGAG